MLVMANACTSSKSPVFIPCHGPRGLLKVTSLIYSQSRASGEGKLLVLGLIRNKEKSQSLSRGSEGIDPVLMAARLAQPGRQPELCSAGKALF